MCAPPQCREGPGSRLRSRRDFGGVGGGRQGVHCSHSLSVHVGIARTHFFGEKFFGCALLVLLFRAQGTQGRQGQRGMCAPLSAGRALGQDCPLGETLTWGRQGRQGPRGETPRKLKVDAGVRGRGRWWGTCSPPWHRRRHVNTSRGSGDTGPRSSAGSRRRFCPRDSSSSPGPCSPGKQTGQG